MKRINRLKVDLDSESWNIKMKSFKRVLSKRKLVDV